MWNDSGVLFVWVVAGFRLACFRFAIGFFVRIVVGFGTVVGLVVFLFVVGFHIICVTRFLIGVGFFLGVDDGCLRVGFLVGGWVGLFVGGATGCLVAVEIVFVHI